MPRSGRHPGDTFLYFMGSRDLSLIDWSESVPEPVLQIDGLTKTFGRNTVVDNVSFEVRRGEMFGFLGPKRLGEDDHDPHVPGHHPAQFRVDQDPRFSA